MDVTGLSIVPNGSKFQIVNMYKIPLGGYSFKSQQRAQEVLDCLARGGDIVDGYLIEPSEVNAKSKAPITSGLGIGGKGSDDHNISTEHNGPHIPTGKSRRNGGGQLWEPCPRCSEEPVHLDCGYCDRHCQC